MSDQLLRLLGICVLVLLYLFLFRVLRAVWASVDATGVPRWSLRGLGRGDSRNGHAVGRPSALVVRSPLSAQGERHPLADGLVIGRSAQCDVIIDDSYSSHEHARLRRRGDQHLIEDLGSVNGTYLNRQKVANETVVRIGDFVQVGSTVFEVSA